MQLNDQQSRQPDKHATLVSALQDNVNNLPDQVFARWVDDKCGIVDSLSYQQLWYESGLVASLLRENQVQPGDRVMIAYDFGLAFLAALFGCMRLGAIACSVYPPNLLDKKKAKHSFAQFDRQVEDAEARIALTSAKFKRGLAGASLFGLKNKHIKWLSTSNLRSKKGSRMNEDSHVSHLNAVRPDSIAFIQYSSGSTGEPKGVVITHQAVVHNLNAIKLFGGIVENSVCVTWMPQYHDYALIGCYLMSCYNSDYSLYACSALDFISKPLLWADMLDKFGGTHTGGPNFSYSLLAKRMKAADRTLNQSKTTLQHANVAAEPIAANTLQEMCEIGIQKSAITPSYGMAEVCAAATYCPGEEVQVIDGVVSSGLLSLSESVGKIIRIGLDDGSMAPDGQEGEIYLRGPDVVTQYWNKPDLGTRFRSRLSDGEDYFASGDLGKIVDGRLYVVGRLKELIIINGRNVYPTDIERIIENEFPDIVRPGSTVAFQRSNDDVGLVIEIRKTVRRMEDVSSVFSIDVVRSLVSDATNVNVGHILVLKQGTVPKTTSGKLKRVETRSRCLEHVWTKTDILGEWSKAIPYRVQEIPPRECVAAPVVETGDDLSNQVLRLVANETCCKLGLKDTLASLSLTSIGVTSLHAAILERFELADEAFPIGILFDNQMKMADLIAFIKEATKSEGGMKTVQPTKQGNEKLTPFIAPTLVTFVGYLLQVVGVLVPPIYLAASIAPLGVIALPRSLGYALLMAPLAAVLYTVTSALLLVFIKWTVLGKLRPGHTAVWGTEFARRWIVRACCRTCFRYTPWRYMNKTEPLGMLQRLLGCRLGRGSSIDSEYIDDFDLITVGSGTTVEGYLNAGQISLGVLTLAPIKVGSNCNLQDICTIQMGSVIEDGVRVHPRSLIVRDSLLPKDSHWQGKPAVRIDSDILNGGCSDIKEREATSRAPQTSVDSARRWYRLTQYLTLFVMTPYLSALFTFLAYITARQLFERVGLIGLSVLIWVPVTLPAVATTSLSIVAKKVLLGNVRPGKWRQHGSFHRRRFIVDHLVDFHVLRWNEISSLFGSPFAHSTYISRLTREGLGGGIGQNTVISRHMKYTGYDLVQLGNNSLWGGGGRCLPWSVRDGYLFGQSVTSGDDVFVGARSTVMGGVRLEDGATVAAYSVASTNVTGDQTVIGVDVKNTNLESCDHRVDDSWVLLVASHLTGLVLWVAASSVTAIVGSLAGSQIPVPTNFLFFWFIWCIGFGTALTVILPLYAAFLSVCSKNLFIGTHLPGETNRDSFTKAVWFWADHLFEPIKDSFFRETFGGTFFETWFFHLLGVRMGTNVYLDSVRIYEPDLVQIGDHSSVGKDATLAPHQINRTKIQTTGIRIGTRSTVGNSAMMHGSDVIHDDTTLNDASMSLAGSTMKGGLWWGYPARRAGPCVQPKRPRLPGWYILLLNPISSFLGLIWWAVLSIEGCLCCRNSNKFTFAYRETENVNFPHHLRGVFESSELPVKLRFECGKWIPHLRLLKLDAGTFIESSSNESFRGSAWCWWVGYNLTFDRTLTDAEGKVSFGGWWHIPESIVCLRLRYDEDSWVAGHSWFSGDPSDEIRLGRSLKKNS